MLDVPSRAPWRRVGAALIVTLHGCPLARAAIDDPPAALSFDFGGQAYPILYAGETISASRPVTITGEFSPLFGADRAVVNPTRPEIRDARTFVFKTPGEYYLKFDGDASLKVLVLSNNEPISESVLRLFDFCCANMLVSAANDGQFYAGGREFVAQWFQHEEPAMLLCGPTQSSFDLLIQDRFGLPVRFVTFPGCAWSNERLIKSTHNVPEVYLPDRGKWVLFDINNAFMAKWLDAIEISRIVRAAATDNQVLDDDQWRALDWKRYAGAPITYRMTDWTATDIVFRLDVLSEAVVQDAPGAMSVLYIGGPAYWGNTSNGTEFLPGAYNFGSLHDDPGLQQAAIDWVESFDFEVTLLPIDELARLLEEGHRPAIEAQAWLARIPPLPAGQHD